MPFYTPNFVIVYAPKSQYRIKQDKRQTSINLRRPMIHLKARFVVQHRWTSCWTQASPYGSIPPVVPRINNMDRYTLNHEQVIRSPCWWTSFGVLADPWQVSVLVCCTHK